MRLAAVIALLLVAQANASQRGFFQAWYGASGGAWTPLNMPNLIAWWDASDESTVLLEAGTNRVDQWLDKSGNGHHASQADASRMPAYRNDVVSGQPVIDMSADIATRAHLDLATNIGGTNKFYYIVYRKTSLQRSVIFSAADDQYDYLHYLSSHWYVGNALQNVGINTNEFTLRGAYTAYSGADILRYSNAVPLTAQAGSDSNLGMNSIGNARGVQFSDIAVMEIVYIDGNPSESDRQKLEGWLAWNNDIVDKLPADHPYKASPP